MDLLDFLFHSIQKGTIVRAHLVLKGIQAALDSVSIAKDRNPQAQDFIEASIIEEIKKSGYIDRLYKK